MSCGGRGIVILSDLEAGGGYGRRCRLEFAEAEGGGMGVTTAEGDSDDFGGAVGPQGDDAVAESAGGVDIGPVQAFEAGGVFSAGLAVGGEGFAVGAADLAAVGVSGEDEVKAGVGEGLGEFGEVAEGDGEEVGIYFNEGGRQVGGVSAEAADAAEVEAAAGGRVDGAGIVVEGVDAEVGESVGQVERVVVAEDGVDAQGKRDAVQEMVEDTEGAVASGWEDKSLAGEADAVGSGAGGEDVTEHEVEAEIADKAHQVGSLFHDAVEDFFGAAEAGGVKIADLEDAEAVKGSRQLGKTQVQFGQSDHHYHILERG